MPSDEIMRQMAKIAIEKATEDLAAMADRVAGEYRRGEFPECGSAAALEIFAEAIREANKRQYDSPAKPS